MLKNKELKESIKSTDTIVYYSDGNTIINLKDKVHYYQNGLLEENKCAPKIIEKNKLTTDQEVAPRNKSNKLSMVGVSNKLNKIPYPQIFEKRETTFKTYKLIFIKGKIMLLIIRS